MMLIFFSYKINIFLNFEIVKITTKFINKFHYEMRFLKKNILYNIICVVLCVSFGYLQNPITPHLLISNSKKELFFSFDNNSLSLYEINNSTTYNQIWEYQFLNNKNSELTSILYGDINGNGAKELLLILYTFGSQGEIYIFSTDSAIPNGKPDIYTFPTLNAGTKPTNAALINWDGDKDDEVLVGLSSPERKILIFDYSINKLVPVDEVGEKFLGSTYGLIDLYVQDLNQDNEEDIIIYNNTQEPSRHIIFSNDDEQNQNIKTPQNTFKTIPIFFNNEINDISLLSTGELFSVQEEKKLKSNIANIKNIISFNNKTVLALTDDKIIQIQIPQFLEKNALNTEDNTADIACISNSQQETILCSNKQKEEIVLYKFDKTPEKITLTKAQQTTTKKIPPPPTMFMSQDTVFANAGETIKIAINQEQTIKSIETLQRPQNIELDAQNLEFLWITADENIGIHTLEYDITYNLNTILEKTDTKNNQLAINTIETTETKKTIQTIYVNDPPKIIIDNIQDTIKLPGTYSTNYIIEDMFYLTTNQLSTLDNNKLLIDNSTIYWEPTAQDAGENKFLLYINDGLAADTLALQIFVDTTTTHIEYNQANLIATVNEEFLYQLNHEPGQKYDILSAPTNLRVSPEGKIHWIPIITQIDNHLIEINVQNNNKNEKHTLEIYVNAPPVISYRPAINEILELGDSLIFQCQNFDMNTNPQLNWKINVEDIMAQLITLSKSGELSIYSDTLLDNHTYSISLSDGIASDIFNGNIYINDAPKIISTPVNYLSLGDTLQYQVQVQDQNKQSPFNKSKPNKLFYKLINSPVGAELDLSNTTIEWVPTSSQIGNHNFNLLVTDSIASHTQTFSIFVNDTPSIISVDSLSIAIGDTLIHHFDAADLNRDSELTYSIKTTIDELLFSGKAGKLTWIPTEEDIGLHMLEINVSDGFSSGTDTQKLKIFVYKNPNMLNKPQPEAFVDIEYLFNPLAEDLFGNSVVSKDISFELEKTDSLFTGIYNLENNTLQWIPTMQEIGNRKFRLVISDKYNHTSSYDYQVNVLLSPCAPSDSIPAIIDSVIVEKVDTVFIKEENKTKTFDNLKWKPKGLGF